MRIVFPHSLSGLAARTPARLALLGAVALLAGGCGTHVVKVESTVVRLRIDEYSITPQDIQIHAGRLKIVAVNTGILTHNVRVQSARAGGGSDPYVPGCVPPTEPTGCGTGVALPGHRVTSPKLTLAPGHYRIVDTLANHADLGEYGTLTVVR